MPKQAQDGRGTTRHPLLPGSCGHPLARLPLLRVLGGSLVSERSVVHGAEAGWPRVQQTSCVGRRNWSSENDVPGAPTRPVVRLRVDPSGDVCNSYVRAMRVCWQSGQQALAVIARAVIRIPCSVLSSCSTEKPGRSGNTTANMNGGSFLQKMWEMWVRKLLTSFYHML